MAIETRTLQVRRGKESEMDKSKFLPAEFGSATDTNKLFHAFAPNKVEEIALKKDVTGLVDNTLSVSGKAADAAVVGKEVSKLSGEIVEINDFLQNVYSYEQGWYSDGNKTVSRYRLRTRDIINTENKIKITSKNGYLFSVVYFDSNKNYVNTSDYIDNIELNNTWFALNIKREDNAEISINEKNNIIVISSEQLPYKVEKLENEYTEIKAKNGDVSYFGAVGDGTTDDTLALQNAVNSGVSHLYFDGTKTYFVNGTITINKKITLHGNGAKIFVKSQELETPLFLIKSRYVNIDGLEIYSTNDQDLILDIVYEGEKTSNIRAIDVRESFVNISNMYFRDITTPIVIADKLNEGTKVRNIYISNIEESNVGIGFLCANCEYVFVNNFICRLIQTENTHLHCLYISKYTSNLWFNDFLFTVTSSGCSNDLINIHPSYEMDFDSPVIENIFINNGSIGEYCEVKSFVTEIRFARKVYFNNVRMGSKTISKSPICLLISNLSSEIEINNSDLNGFCILNTKDVADEKSKMIFKNSNITCEYLTGRFGDFTIKESDISFRGNFLITTLSEVMSMKCSLVNCDIENKNTGFLVNLNKPCDITLINNIYKNNGSPMLNVTNGSFKAYRNVLINCDEIKDTEFVKSQDNLYVNQ